MSDEIAGEQATRRANFSAILTKFQHFQNAVVQERSIQMQYVGSTTEWIKQEMQIVMDQLLSDVHVDIPGNEKLDELEGRIEAMETGLLAMASETGRCLRDAEGQFSEIAQSAEELQSEVLRKLTKTEDRMGTVSGVPRVLRRELQALTQISLSSRTERIEAFRQVAADVSDFVRAFETDSGAQSNK
jgi:hypothetical protein